MTPELILWGITGYLTLFIIQTRHPGRNRSGWDFVALVSLFSLINFVLGHSLAAIARQFAFEIYRQLALLWQTISGGQPSHSLPFGLAASVMTGLVFAWLRDPTLMALHLLAGGKRTSLLSDLLFAQLGDFLGKPILVSLSNGKIYMGLLIRATEDPNESDRFISIQPLLSGVRHKETQRVTFDTNYQIANELKPKLATVLLPMRSVISIASFDYAVHKAFVEKGITTLAPSAVVQVGLPAPPATPEAPAEPALQGAHSGETKK